MSEVLEGKAIELYPFQKKMIRELYSCVRQGKKRIALVAGTGAGKTVIASQIVSDVVGKGHSVLFLVTIDCLVEQSLEKLESFGHEVGIIAGGYPKCRYREGGVYVASLQTLANRQSWLSKNWGVIIFDEAHTSAWFGIADKIFEQFPGWIFGLTATPFRLSKRQGFGDKFEDVVLAPNMVELTKDGALTPMVYMALECPDLSGVRASKGDYRDEDISIVCDHPETIKTAINGWEQHAKDMKTIVFAVDVSHAKAIAREFNDRGYPAAVVSGKTPRKVRKDLFDKLDFGLLTALVSCNALSTGFDLPSVECGLLMRPTQSKALHIQQIGRVARVSPGKTYGLILDAAGNLERCGFPEQISASLTKESILSAGVTVEPGEAPQKMCPECKAWVLTFVMGCPKCGYQFPVSDSKEKVAAMGSFVELMNPAIVALGGLEEHREFYRYLLRKHWRIGNSPPRAYVEYLRCNFERFPRPAFTWGEHAIFPNPTREDYEGYFQRMEGYKVFLDKDDEWFRTMLLIEFGVTFVREMKQHGSITA